MVPVHAFAWLALLVCVVYLFFTFFLGGIVSLSSDTMINGNTARFAETKLVFNDYSYLNKSFIHPRRRDWMDIALKGKKHAICFVSVSFKERTYNLAQSILSSRSDVVVFYLIDAVESWGLWETDGGVHMIALNQSVASAGFRKSDVARNFANTEIVDRGREAIGRDKIFYLFCQIYTSVFKLMWLLEDDVYFHSIQVFNRLIDSVDTHHPSADLVISTNNANLNGQTVHLKGKHKGRHDWHWHLVQDSQLRPPWYASITCAVGVSPLMLQQVANYAAKENHLEYVEILLNTLAMHANLTVVTPPELSTVLYRHEWTCIDVQQNPNNWFHPVKNWSALQQCEISR